MKRTLPPALVRSLRTHGTRSSPQTCRARSTARHPARMHWAAPRESKSGAGSLPFRLHSFRPSQNPRSPSYFSLIHHPVGSMDGFQTFASSSAGSGFTVAEGSAARTFRGCAAVPAVRIQDRENSRRHAEKPPVRPHAGAWLETPEGANPAPKPEHDVPARSRDLHSRRGRSWPTSKQVLPQKRLVQAAVHGDDLAGGFAEAFGDAGGNRLRPGRRG